MASMTMCSARPLAALRIGRQGVSARALAARPSAFARPEPKRCQRAKNNTPHRGAAVRAVADGGAMSKGHNQFDDTDPLWDGDGEDEPRWRREVEDTESEEFAVAMATIADATKGVDIMVLNVMPVVYWTRYMVVATAFNKPQLDAICFRMSELAKEKYDRELPNGLPDTSDWMLLDYGDVVVHVFTPAERGRYDIEGFYATAAEVDLPFESERPEAYM